MKDFYKKELLRHKLFYLGVFPIVTLIIFFLANTWIVQGWIKYCNSGKLNITDFNSVFELCATFNLAYTVVIRFRRVIKDRAYAFVDKRLKIAEEKAGLVLLTNNRRLLALSEYISDISAKRKKEVLSEDIDSGHRGEDAFLYFGFYSLICIVTGGLIQGFQAPQFHFEVILFLFIFSFTSIIIVEARYNESKTSSFEVTTLLFFINLVLCFTIARFAEIEFFNPIVNYLYKSNILFYSQNNKFQTVINYVTLLLIFINIYPYFIFFRKLYFIAFRYVCTSYQIMIVVKIKTNLKIISDFIGDIVNIIKRIFIIPIGELFIRIGNYIKNIGEK